MSTKGKDLLEELKEYVFSIMQSLPECAPDGPGCRYTKIQEIGDLNVSPPGPKNVPSQDGWITWILLWALARENKIESTEKKFSSIGG